MSDTIPTPNLHYAATLLRKLTDSLAEDPSAADFARLNGKMLEIALAVYSEGREKSARRNRLQAELAANHLEAIQADIDAADPKADLAALQTSSGWEAFDLADVLTEDIPPIRWLVKPYLARPSVTAWFGKPKAMKSLLVLDMCLHIAGGYAWLSDTAGQNGIEVSPARVVWLDLENGERTLKRRMKAIAKALGFDGERERLLAYSMPAPWPDLSKPENASALIIRLQSLGDVSVLVIDHLGQVFGAVDENSPLASQIMGTIRQISEACNVAIVLIHHAKKGQGKEGGALEDQLRGSGAILAGVDAAFLVERDKVDRTQLKLIPVAVRGPEVKNVSAQFSYEQDENLDLTQARFWRMAWRDDFARARDAILKVLQDGKKNHTELRAAVKSIEPGISDQKIREAISALEGAKEIYYITAGKGAKIYQLAGEHEDED